MKISTLILAGSLAVNAALVVLIVAGGSAGSEASAPARPTTETMAAVKAASATPGPETWGDLSSENLAVMRDRLRAAGFPAALVRSILAAQIRESFSARRKAIEDAQGEVPFWKNPARDPKTTAALRDLGREQEKILKDLLGRDWRDDDPTYAAYLRRQFGDLPGDKVDQLRRIMDDYNNQRSDIYSAARNGLLPDEQQKVAALDKAMRAEFATVLTPKELEDYDLRGSNTAQSLRYNLTAFDATEDEYRAIFKLQFAFDDKYSRMYGPMSQDEMKARSDAQKQLNEDIKTALGAERYTDYQRATDYYYRQTSQLVARLELPPDTAKQLWTVQKEFEQKRTEVFQSTTTPDARNQQLAALAQEATARVTPLLGGSRGFEAYKQNGGQWVVNLIPRPPPKN